MLLPKIFALTLLVTWFSTSQAHDLDPNELRQISVGEKFAVQIGDTVELERGALLHIKNIYRNDAKRLGLSLSYKGYESFDHYEIGRSTTHANFLCFVTYYGARQDGDSYVYSLHYDCPN